MSKGGRRRHTGLHGDEAGPGVVGAAVTETGDETAGQDGDICVLDGDFGLEIAEA